MRTPSNPNAIKRRTAYLNAMEQLGHEPLFLQVDGEGWDFEAIGFREGGRMIGRRDLPTNTILCSNDRLAIGLLSAAYELGLRVGIGAGSALRVAKHDYHPFSRYTCPSLTTVSQDYSSIAKTSVEILFDIVESGQRPDVRSTTLFDGTLIA